MKHFNVGPRGHRLFSKYCMIQAFAGLIPPSRKLEEKAAILSLARVQEILKIGSA